MKSETSYLEMYQPIYNWVNQVPIGKVVTYGQVADCVEETHFTARQVGHALSLSQSPLNWQRVVGAGGHIVVGRRSPEMRLLQIRLLREEGVHFLETDPERVNMALSQWQPHIV